MSGIVSSTIGKLQSMGMFTASDTKLKGGGGRIKKQKVGKDEDVSNRTQQEKEKLKDIGKENEKTKEKAKVTITPAKRKASASQTHQEVTVGEVTKKVKAGPAASKANVNVRAAAVAAPAPATPTRPIATNTAPGPAAVAAPAPATPTRPIATSTAPGPAAVSAPAPATPKKKDNINIIMRELMSRVCGPLTLDQNDWYEADESYRKRCMEWMGKEVDLVMDCDEKLVAVGTAYVLENRPGTYDKIKRKLNVGGKHCICILVHYDVMYVQKRIGRM